MKQREMRILIGMSQRLLLLLQQLLQLLLHDQLLCPLQPQLLLLLRVPLSVVSLVLLRPRQLLPGPLHLRLTGRMAMALRRLLLSSTLLRLRQLRLRPRGEELLRRLVLLLLLLCPRMRRRLTAFQ